MGDCRPAAAPALFHPVPVQRRGVADGLRSILEELPEEIRKDQTLMEESIRQEIELLVSEWRTDSLKITADWALMLPDPSDPELTGPEFPAKESNCAGSLNRIFCDIQWGDCQMPLTREEQTFVQTSVYLSCLEGLTVYNSTSASSTDISRASCSFSALTSPYSSESSAA